MDAIFAPHPFYPDGSLAKVMASVADDRGLLEWLRRKVQSGGTRH
jgi:hypothetical protein